MMQKEPFYFEDDDYIDVDSLCLLIILYAPGDYALKSKILFDLIIKDDDGYLSDDEFMKGPVQKIYMICARNLIDYYYGLLKTREYAPSNEALTEIRMVRRMAENHIEDFLDSIVGQFLGNIQ